LEVSDSRHGRALWVGPIDVWLYNALGYGLCIVVALGLLHVADMPGHGAKLAIQLSAWLLLLVMGWVSIGLTIVAIRTRLLFVCPLLLFVGPASDVELTEASASLQVRTPGMQSAATFRAHRVV
jgi:hypothetical protein